MCRLSTSHLHFLDYDDSDQVEVDPEFLQLQAERLVEALERLRLKDGSPKSIRDQWSPCSSLSQPLAYVFQRLLVSQMT